MPKLLFIESSPRGADSTSTLGAEHFVSALEGSYDVETLNLWQAELPEFADTFAKAKYRNMGGQPLSDDETAAWAQIEALVAHLKQFDAYVIAAPMWNYSIPYKLKHYIDLVTHFGLTFEPTKDGIKGLVGGCALMIYARGGSYGGVGGTPDPFDFQSTYMKAWLGLLGIDPVDEVAVENSLSPKGAEHLTMAKTQLDAIAARWLSQ